MKRSTASWTTAVAASALLALPVGSWAQQPTPSTTPREQTTGAPAPQTGRTPGADTQQGSANEHLRQAQSALADIPAASLTGTAKTRVAELKRHLSAVERAASQKPASGATTTARSASWTTDVAAADRILTELLGSTGTTGAATPAPAGTTGSTSTAAAPRTTTGANPEASITLDESARTKLQEVRTHITAFAAAMSGGSASSPSSTPAPSSDDPSAPASASAASATPSPAAATGATAPTPTGTSGRTAAPTEPAATPATPAEPPAASATPAQSSTQPPATAPATPSPTPSQQVDAETVKRHLTAARDALSQLTQLPAAAQLTGDARTQVSQLISNFNELLTTNVDWRSAYSKLQGNLTALVGDQRADESPTPAAPAAGVAGAAGTSGTAAIDPAIRAKLVEFRSHLTEFEKAAGGSGTPAEPSAAASTTAAPPTSTTAAPSASTTAAPSASTTATPSASTTATSSSSTASTATASPAPAATTGSTSQTPATAGTSGTGTPMPAAAQQATKPSTSGRDAADSQAAEGHREAMTRIEAIEAILNGASPAGTSGDTASKTTTKPGTLEHAQIQQIRTHLAELRKELNKSR